MADCICKHFATDVILVHLRDCPVGPPCWGCVFDDEPHNVDHGAPHLGYRAAF